MKTKRKKDEPLGRGASQTTLKFLIVYFNNISTYPLAVSQIDSQIPLHLPHHPQSFPEKFVRMPVI